MLTYGYLYVKALLDNLFTNEEGQAMAEYGLILALIAVVVIVALTFMGTALNDFFELINAALTTPAP